MIGRVHLQLNSEPCGAPAYTYSKHTLVYWTYRPFEQLEYNTMPFIVRRNVWSAKQGPYTQHAAADNCTYIHLVIHYLKVKAGVIPYFLLLSTNTIRRQQPTFH